MNYYRFDKALQAVIDASIQLSSSQKGRIKEACEGVLLARSSQLSWIARRLPQETNKDSRIKWLSRLLKTRYMSQEFVYRPFVKKMLSQHKPAQLHVLMDRTAFTVHDTDLVSLSLNFRK